MRTRVCITIDTEFSIAGAFSDPALRPVAEPMVTCDVAGRSQGLDFLLATFQRHDIPATFFVEALNRQYFKHDPMAAIARRIHGQGHEVQLHVHPCWSVFRHADWRERVRACPRQDDFFGRDEADTLALIRQGMEAFSDWDLPPPQAFRAGNLQHDDALYQALARSGIRYSSNIGLAVFDSGDPRYALYGGRHERHGVIECPVLTYCDWRLGRRPHLKTLTIAGTSFAEMKTLLEQAHRIGLSLVVILSHPFEYIQSRDQDLRHARRHGIAQRRLTALCQYLDHNRDRYTPSGIAAAAIAVAPDHSVARDRPVAPDHSVAPGHPVAPSRSSSPENPLLEGRLLQSLDRLALQATYACYGQAALLATRGGSR
ncbi:polysaccharide deacetylase family protein [Duganella aceris]|uniref:Polysaccharide deacetylase family protein n=1 Tax=Duganella aceris TaxID=2703883 RepID=A0ABX0FUP0_9BURK|nr:polysaccharide deacetylase family protein [Duganella aceris]NGZ88118.1 polysaccharide deacetylase family protein [Duganella aceris]